MEDFEKKIGSCYYMHNINIKRKSPQSFERGAVIA